MSEYNNLQMYADFLKESNGAELLEHEHGFATYRFEESPVGECVYLMDIYVKPEKRKSKICFNMADEVVEEAKKNGIKYLIGSVDLRINGADISKKVLLAYGLKPAWYDEPTQYYIKEI